MKRLVALTAVLVLAACGETPTDANGDGIADGDPQTPDSITAVAPSSPKGRITGRVFDSQGQPLPEVEVTLSAKDAPKAVTDAMGMFAIDKITGGSTVGLSFSRSGYASAWATATVPGTTGNFPLNDGEVFVGPIGLLGNTGELTFHVVGYDGALIAAPTGIIDVTPGFLEFRASGTNVFVTGQNGITATATGADGVLQFKGIPKVEEMTRLKSLGVSAKYSIYVPPVFDANGALLYAGKTASYSAEVLLTQPWTRTIVLPAPGAVADIEIEATNVQNLVEAPSEARENLISASGPILVVFNQRIASSVFAQVYDDNDKAAEQHPLPINVEVNSIGNQLRITPKAGGFAVGQKYFLSLQVTSRDNPEASVFKASGSFFIGDVGTPKPPTPTVRFEDAGNDSILGANETVEIEFNHYIGRGDGKAFSLPVYFDRKNLGGNPDKADVPGELGSGRPLCVASSERIPAVTGAAATGYARMAKATPTSMGIPAIDLNAGPVSVTIAFGEALKCGGPVHSLWGENLTGELTTNLLRIEPAPAP